ncbi:MAG: hypothetical protein ACOYMA_19060 [Bacteroidia bacterium]
MESQSEFQSLQNFASTLNLTVHKFYPNDSRKKMQWFLSSNGMSVSPKMDYNGMNAFMLGYRAAKNCK